MKIDFKRALGSTLPIAGLMIFTFQNCSKVNFGADLPSNVDVLGSSAVVINDGAEFTNEGIVKLSITNPHADEMYVTNDFRCEKDGQWEKMAPVKNGWSLKQTNARAEVFVKFKSKAGIDLPCVSASIIHDDKSPTARIVRGPAEYSNNTSEEFGLDGHDALSGISYFECRLGDVDFQRCPANFDIQNLNEGNQSFQVRAVDRAGNRSPVVGRFWVVDRTPPTITVTGPTALVPNPYASFELNAQDDRSGVSRIFCQVDGGVINDRCTPIQTVYNLSNGTHTLTAWAIDKAGNESTRASHTISVDSKTPENFIIMGVTGGEDHTIDKYLGTTLIPTLHWTESVGAHEYTLNVLDSVTGAYVCNEKATSQGADPNFGHMVYPYSNNDCVLQDGKSYIAKIVAERSNGKTATATLTFTVDTTPPVIHITGPTNNVNDVTKAKFEFEVQDPVSGVKTATCTKMFGEEKQEFNCKAPKKNHTFTSLPNGEHSFSISATDVAGNKAVSAPIKWNVKLVICDPFSSIEGGCKKGLRANLFYRGQGQPAYNKVDDYINLAKQANAVVYMSQLLVPTTYFSDGFSSSDQTTLTDDNGNKLVEYFALDLETIVKLGPNDEPGLYQFGILSDDGSVIQIKDTGVAGWDSAQVLIDNDGYHSTKLACDMKGIEFTGATRQPMRIKYFQAPRHHIALTLLWRKVDKTDPSSFSDSACGVESTNFYFGPNFATQPDFENYEFGKMKQRGWKPLAPENFILEEDVE